jgi:hypothetical protein
VAALFREVAGCDEAVVGLVARVAQGVAVAVDAALGAVDVLAAGDVGDRAATAGEEVLDG